MDVEVEGQRAWLLAADADAPWENVRGLLRLIPQYDCHMIGSRFGREDLVPEGRARVRVQEWMLRGRGSAGNWRLRQRTLGRSSILMSPSGSAHLYDELSGLAARQD